MIVYTMQPYDRMFGKMLMEWSAQRRNGRTLVRPFRSTGQSESNLMERLVRRAASRGNAGFLVGSQHPVDGAQVRLGAGDDDVG